MSERIGKVPAQGATGAAPARAGGFTYIGVLLLVVMAGIALSVVSGVWQVAQKREKEKELLFIGSQFRRALAQYAANGGGNPRTLEDLLKDPRVPGVRRALRRIYRDPMTGSAQWGLVKVGGLITGVYSLSEEEPLKQSQFRLADQAFEGKKKYSEWVFLTGAVQAVPGVAGTDSTATARYQRPRARYSQPAALLYPVRSIRCRR